jgi:hypothetical protein
MKILSGYKTYALVGIVIVVNILHFKFHVISDDVAVPLYGVLLPLIVAALRDGMRTENERLKEEIEKGIKEETIKKNG